MTTHVTSNKGEFPVSKMSPTYLLRFILARKAIVKHARAQPAGALDDFSLDDFYP